MEEALYRISGHESFPCRYTWLPKAVRELDRDPKFFSDEEKAMVDMGVGKNMVRSVRFWANVAGMATPGAKGGGHVLTDLGRTLLGDRGLDPFLEDIRTLWLIHWNLSTHTKNPLLAWDFLLNRWQEPELVPSAVLRVLQKEAAKRADDLSPVTIDQHWDTFLHAYVPTRGRKGEVQEDNLDCPLVELELIVRVGERTVDRAAGRAEPVYAFRREPHHKRDERYRVLPTLKRIRELVQKEPDARVNITTLFDELRKPSYGVRDGMIPLLLTVFAIAHEQEVAFYKDR